MRVEPYLKWRDRQTREYLETLMNEAGGNVTEAARLSHLNRTWLHKMLVEYGLRKKSRSKHSHFGNELWQSLGK